MPDQPTTSGVQDLIDRLSQEGVAEGQRKAEDLVHAAQEKAQSIVDAARQQANDILQNARQEAEQFQAAGEEALRLAARDTQRDFGARIHEGFRNRLQELVRHQLTDPDFIKRMILEITRQASEGLDEDGVELLLPPDFVTEDDARQRIEAGDHDELTEFLQGLLGEDLREGFSVNLGNERQSGLTVRVVNKNVEIDLTEEAITELLARHLLPRFRAIMRKT